MVVYCIHGSALGSDKEVVSYNPTDNTAIASVRLASLEDYNQTVDLVTEAQRDWRNV